MKWVVERAIQTAKRNVEITKLANEDHYLSIMFLNSQPDKNRLPLAHKLFNRQIRTYIPSVKLQPKPSTTDAAIWRYRQNKNRQRETLG